MAVAEARGAVMPPIDPPITAAHVSIPSSSASAASTATWSRIVMIGYLDP